MNLDGADVHVLDPWGGTSHFVWRDPNHIFAWAWHPSHEDRFYLYEDKTDKVEVVGPDVMIVNGHNTYVPGTNNAWVLNDTYPDTRTLQNPYLYHIPTNRRVPLGHFPSPREYRGEWRCDTHPCASRDGKKVIFDSPHDGGRQVYLIDISGIVG
jgi:Tol biopolymer transport system component